MPSMSDQEMEILHRYICEGVGDPKRLKLLYLMAERAQNVTELTEALDISQPTVSHHLRILRERGLVKTRREGTSVYYSLSDPRILQAMDIMRSVVTDLIKNSPLTMEDKNNVIYDL